MIIKEAVDPRSTPGKDTPETDVPGFFSRDKRERIERGDKDLEKLLPELSKEYQSYIELLASNSYRNAIQRVQRYTKRSPAELRELSVPALMREIMGAIKKVIQLEKGNESKLTQLALEVILELPEFKLAKFHVDTKDLKYELKLGLGTPTLKDASQQFEASTREMEMDDQLDPSDPDAENKLTKIEKMDGEIARTFTFDEQKSRNTLRRVLAAGNSIHKFYLFQLLNNKINPELINLYGIACSYIHLLYYAQPDLDLNYQNADAMGATQGSCQVIRQKDGTALIKAAGVMLPYLIHEIVKCTYEYLSGTRLDTEILDNEELDDEIIHLLTGDNAWTVFTQHIGSNNQELIPLVYQKFLKLPAEDIKAVFANNNQSKPIIDKLVRASRIEFNEYERKMEEHKIELEEYERKMRELGLDPDKDGS